MNYEVFRKQALESLDKIRRVLEETLPGCTSLNSLSTLIQDIEADFFTMVTVGEFKRGKSTFVNAVLGEELLPTDVTPTTAHLHAVGWGEERRAEVVWEDGSQTYLDLTRGELQRFTVENSNFNQDVRYIKVNLPANILKDRVVLIDTPGVNDVNKQRSEITDSFLPRADVVIYVMDINTPLRRTELEFLEEHLKFSGSRRYILVANFIDYVEPEEISSLVETIRRRLIMVVGSREHIEILPFSARVALEAQLSGDRARLSLSGYEAIRQKLQEIVLNGPKSEERITQLRDRIRYVMAGVHVEISSERAISSASDEGLHDEILQLQMMAQRLESSRQYLDDYAHQVTTEVLYIIEKSFSYFAEVAMNDTIEDIGRYRGPDFKEFVESDVPVRIKKQLRSWLAQYSPAIEHLEHTYGTRLSEGLAALFSEDIPDTVVQLDDAHVDLGEVRFTAPDGASPAYVQSGMVAGGVAIAAALLTGGLLVPVVSLALFPVIQRKFLSRHLENTKAEVIPKLKIDLQQHFETVRQQILSLVENQLEQIKIQAEKKLEELLETRVRRVKTELEIREHKRQANVNLVDTLESLSRVLTTLTEELDDFLLTERSV